MISRALSFILCLILPPIGVYALRGMSFAFFLSLALTGGAVAVFFGFYAGPGLALYGLSVLHAAIVGVLPNRPVAAI